MHVFLTGGTGFVGSHLIEALRAEGHNVRALVRRDADCDRVTELGASPFVGNLEIPDSLADACTGCDTVIHAAARVDIVGSEAEFFGQTVGGTESLVASANRAGVHRFVYVSSCGVFHPGIMRSGVPIREDTPTGSPPKWWLYGRSKLAAEAVVRDQIRPPAEWSIIRLAYLYGPRNRAMRQYLYPLLSAKGAFRFIGNGENQMAMIHVRDCVRAILGAATVPAAAGQIFIAAPTEHITQRRYFTALSEGLGLPAPRGKIPYWLAYAAASVIERVRPTFMGGAFTRGGVCLTGLPQLIDCTHTQRVLNWKPEVAFDDGIRDACEWFIGEHVQAMQD